MKRVPAVIASAVGFAGIIALHAGTRARLIGGHNSTRHLKSDNYGSRSGTHDHFGANACRHGQDGSRSE